MSKPSRPLMCLPLVLLALLVLAPAARAGNWPGFRGPSGQGVSDETGVPLKWGPEENVAWKTEVPGVGWSSPIVWEDRVFLTATTEDGTGCHVVSVDRKTGKVLWDTEVFKQTPKRKEGKNSYASPTPVTDGKAVYAFFGGGGAAAVDFDGKTLWTNTENDFYSQHGLGASPVLFEGLLIMPFDGSSPGPDTTVGWKKPWDQAFILALDTKTGKEKYKARRGLSRIAHITPRLTEVGGKPLLVSGAGDVIQGFDPRTGELLWTVASQGEGVVPSIVIGEDLGLAFTSSGFEASAIRTVRLDPAAKGDVTKTHIAWEQTRAVPTQPSFLYLNGLLFTVRENGIALCLDAKTGDIHWQKRIEGEYSASPVAAENRIYFLNEAGRTTVIEAGKAFKVLAENDLNPPGRCQASPAVSDGQIFIRSERHLFCVGTKPRE